MCTPARSDDQSLMLLLVLYATVILALAAACPPCDPVSCPQDPERDCPLGPAPDPCQCCPMGVCGLEEGRSCYNATVFKNLPDRKRLGVCASNMECVLRNDLTPADGLETVCICADKRTACGSDNQTYESTCKMYRVQNNKRVTLQYWGPCHHAPQVTSGPEGVEIFVGQPMTLACEGKGFPVPSITWEFVGADGALTALPGDDSSISVQIRGGPEALMVSSWIQINQGRRKDSGTYSCVVTNHKGSSRALAEVSVKT